MCQHGLFADPVTFNYHTFTNYTCYCSHVSITVVNSKNVLTFMVWEAIMVSLLIYDFMGVYFRGSLITVT